MSPDAGLFDPPARVWPASPLRLGTCSWTAEGWAGTFYPPGTKSTDFIAHYAQRFSSVEIDASFYGLPREETLHKWRDSTPDGFVFAAKAPKLITHDKFLIDCAEDVEAMLARMQILGPKLGPILFQFPYFAKRKGVELAAFIDRLAPVLDLLPKAGFRFSVEVRNKTWIQEPLLALLHAHGVALCVIDHPWMSKPDRLFAQDGIVTAPFLYVRWLGDRFGIEKITQVWNKTVVDREADLEAWASPIEQALRGNVDVYGYVNNHYGGYAVENVAYLEQRLAAWGAA